jgi:hypothetical protein
VTPTDPDDADRDSAGRLDVGGARDVATASTGFVWCESTSDPDGSGETGGFEWCEPKSDDAAAATTPEEAEEAEDCEPSADVGEEDDEDDAGDDLLLDPEIVTTTRAAGIDDDAVALLSALRLNHAARDESDADGR